MYVASRLLLMSACCAATLKLPVGSVWFVLGVQCYDTSFNAVRAFNPRMAGLGVVKCVGYTKKIQLIFFSLYLQGMFTVPSWLIMEQPYAERTASFFSKASGLGFPSSSNSSGAIMRSSQRGSTLLWAPLSTLHCRFIFRFFSGCQMTSSAKALSRVSLETPSLPKR